MAVYRLVSNLNILFLLKDLSRTELACGPQVSPTATYQEIIQGKNMTLVCTVTSIPEAKISWWYRGLFINNGSTMVSDIGVMFSHRGRLSIFVLLFATNISNNNYVVVGGGWESMISLVILASIYEELSFMFNIILLFVLLYNEM